MFEEFMEQIDTDKDMRANMNLYKNNEVIEEKKKLALLKKVEK